MGHREPVAQPSALAGAARAEQEAAPVRTLGKSTCKFHFGSKNGNGNSDLRPDASPNQSRHAA